MMTAFPCDAQLSPSRKKKFGGSYFESPHKSNESYMKSCQNSDNEHINWTESLTQKSPSEICSKLPKRIRNALHSFQRKAVEFAVSRDGRLIIGDEMGLGKTIQAIAIAAYYKRDWPVLIILPSHMKQKWKAELLDWLPEYVDGGDVNVITKGTDKISGSHNFTIISYSLAAKMVQKISSIAFQIIICDESHKMKSKDAQQTKLLVPVIQRASRRILLSGTATPSRPIELHSQLQCLRPPGLSPQQWFLTRSDYGVRHCDAKETLFGWNDRGSSNLRELHLILHKLAMIRRLKADVLPELPQKTRHIHEFSCPQNSEITDIMKRVSKAELSKLVHGAEKPMGKFFKSVKMQKQGGDGDDEIDANLRVAEAIEREQQEMLRNLSAKTSKRRDFAILYKETGLCKLKKVIEYIDSLHLGKTKVLIFGHHKEVLDGLEKYAISKKNGYIRIDGKVPVNKRHSLVDRFQTSDHCQIAILAITAAGQGLTLTSASVVIFAELNFVPAMLLQCEDRVHRIGQKNHVSVHYCLAQKTLDDVVWPMIHRKLKTINRTLDGRYCNASLKTSKSPHTPKFYAAKEAKAKNIPQLKFLGKKRKRH